MPLIPSSFIVVRNVIISANWSQKDLQQINTYTSLAAINSNIPMDPIHLLSSTEVRSNLIRREPKPAISRVVWGPFTLAGKYYRRKINGDFCPQFDGTTLTIPGMQILAFNNSVVPLCTSQ
jgi:hypothetical protein